MAYETCPQCGARKHQLVACPQCGFKRMTTRPPIDRELLDEEEESPRSRTTTAAPVSSNFETCPTCGTRKHLLMACPECGFSRSGNPERLAQKPPHEPKAHTETRPRYPTNKPRYASSPPTHPHAHPHAHPPTHPPTHYVSNPSYDPFEREYHGPSVVEQDRTAPQHTPVVRWKRSKVPNRGRRESG